METLLKKQIVALFTEILPATMKAAVFLLQLLAPTICSRMGSELLLSVATQEVKVEGWEREPGRHTLLLLQITQAQGSLE